MVLLTTKSLKIEFEVPLSTPLCLQILALLQIISAFHTFAPQTKTRECPLPTEDFAFTKWKPLNGTREAIMSSQTMKKVLERTTAVFKGRRRKMEKRKPNFSDTSKFYPAMGNFPYLWFAWKQIKDQAKLVSFSQRTGRTWEEVNSS